MNESIKLILSGYSSINEEFELYNLEQWRELIEELFIRLKETNKDYYILKQQLQSYKQKEDKLREYCKSCIGELNYEINDWLDDSKIENNDVIEDLEIQKQIFKDVLQMLNEGDK